MGVGYLAGESDLLLKPRQDPGIPRHFRQDRFQSHSLVERQILSFVNLTHPAPADKANDSEPVEDDLSSRPATWLVSGNGGIAQKRLSLYVVVKQPQHLAAQLLIARAGVLREACAFRWIQFHRAFEKLFDLSPPLRCHKEPAFPQNSSRL
jgi:hypothetical protein